MLPYLPEAVLTNRIGQAEKDGADHRGTNMEAFWIPFGATILGAILMGGAWIVAFWDSDEWP